MSTADHDSRRCHVWELSRVSPATRRRLPCPGPPDGSLQGQAGSEQQLRKSERVDLKCAGGDEARAVVGEPGTFLPVRTHCWVGSVLGPGFLRLHLPDSTISTRHLEIVFHRLWCGLRNIIVASLPCNRNT